MNTEQLKLLIDLIQNAGAGTKELAIWYIASTIVEPVLVSITILGIVLSLIRLCRTFIKYKDGWEQVCDALDMPNYRNEPTKSDIKRVVERLKRND